ncbi:MAG: substrate-binding domain-containing protein [Spirochaetaceae bacterium]|nr:substrate-binding domain-containing protein [Spirochaetaceae bacterium]
MTSRKIAARAFIIAAAALSAAAAVLGTASALAACGPARRTLKEGEVPVIGFSMDSLVVERWRRDLEVFTRSARELGALVIVRVADQDAAVQDQQVRELAGEGIDVLVVVPNDADGLAPAVKYVKSRGIPVLSYDRLVRRARVDLYLSFDNEKVGSLMAESLSRAASEGTGFVVINGAKSDNNALMLGTGIHAILDPLVAAGKARIVAEIWPSTWDSDEARRELEEAIARGEEFGALIAGNDMLAEAAIGVLSENRVTALVSGQDADLAACQRIAEGSQYSTVYKPIDRLALKAAGFAVMLARGEKVPADSTIDDGSGKVPYVRLEPVLVTKSSLESTVIKDGFHTAAEVYRNIERR